MIIFQCTCGVAGVAGEPGTVVACEGCGASCTVPAASVPGYVLIFRSGSPSYGTPVAVEIMAEQAEAGALKATDLIWYEEKWLPLGEVYELPAEEPEATNAGLPEIALEFQSLPAVEGYAKPPRHKAPSVVNLGAIGAEGKRKKRSNPFRFNRSSLTLANLKKYLKLAAVLAILVYGGLRALSILNFVLKRPAHVLVYNSFGRDCRAHLAGTTWEDIPKGAYHTFSDIYVSLSGRRRLDFEGTVIAFPAVVLEPGDPRRAPLMSLRIPVRAGQETVVNPGGKLRFGVYNLADFGGTTLASPELSALAQALVENQSPAAALKIAEQLQELGQKSLIEVRQDEIFSNTTFSFAMLPVNRGEAAIATKPEVTPARPLLVYPLAQRLNGKNCALLFDPDNVQTERNILLPLKELELSKNSRMTLSGQRLTFHYLRNGLQLQMNEMRGYYSDAANHRFDGNWSYQAKLGPNDVWSWQWTFKGGRQTKGNKSEEVQVAIDQEGKEKVVKK